MVIDSISAFAEAANAFASFAVYELRTGVTRDRPRHAGAAVMQERAPLSEKHSTELFSHRAWFGLPRSAQTCSCTTDKPI
jgi:hypothetical protein